MLKEKIKKKIVKITGTWHGWRCVCADRQAGPGKIPRRLRFIWGETRTSRTAASEHQLPFWLLLTLWVRFLSL